MILWVSAGENEMSKPLKLTPAEKDHLRKMCESILEMEQGQVQDFEEVSAGLFRKYFPPQKK